MALESNSPIFCMCGGLWIVNQNENEKVFICPSCGNQQPIPEDTSAFILKIYNEKKV